MSGRPVGTPHVIPWQHGRLPQCALPHTSTVECMGCLCRVWQCVHLLTPAKDFRERCSDDRAVLELFQKALKELECVMEGECACVFVRCRCVHGLVNWEDVAVYGCGGGCC